MQGVGVAAPPRAEEARGMRRTDFLLDLIRTRNAAAIAALVALVVVGRMLGNRGSTWIVVLLGLLAVTLGYVLSGHNN
jgi:TRAP-type C4-dicarboxylate transport system permease small subunit